MTKTNRVEALISHYANGKPGEFAKFLGVAPSTISSWKARNTMDFDLVFAKCENISPRWLLSGDGDMFDSNTKSIEVEESENIYTADNSPLGIPLIPVDAMAGFFTGEVSVNRADCDHILIPGLKADFIISVAGNSMEPRFYSGDFVACTMTTLNDKFFQYGRVYVIDTADGVLLKKVRKGLSSDTIQLVSENPSYDPFELPKTNIYHIALVKGLIRFE